MKLQRIAVDHYRSIEHVEIEFPVGKPVVLFGPNNAGKSNILSAIDRLLGERYPTYIEMLDSDFYMRNKALYPSSMIQATFEEPYYYDRYGKPFYTVAVTYGYGGNPNEHLIHDGYGQKLYISGENRAACQSYLIDAERNIQSAFNYSSKYSLLSKFSHKIHQAWVVAPDAYVVKYDYAYFGIDFETYFRASMPEYGKKEKEAIEVYGITSKPGKV